MRAKIIFLISLSLCACDSFLVSQTSESAKELSNHESTAAGIQWFLSEKSLVSNLSKEYYLVNALLTTETSRVELFSHFQNWKLEDGVRLQFERHGIDLKILLSVPGYPPQILLQKQGYFSLHNELDLTIAVENGTNYGCRVQIWENFLNRHGILKRKAGVLTGENLLVDSFAEAHTFYTKGQGLKWGIKLSQALLLNGSRISPNVY